MDTDRSVSKQGANRPDGRVRLERGTEAILDGAEGLIRQGGMEKLTIGAVAARVGITKAGVLHHFANKRALVLALVERDYERFSRNLAVEREAVAARADLTTRQRALLAYTRAVLADADASDSLRLSLSLACILDPSLVDGLGVAQNNGWDDLDLDDEDDVGYAIARLMVEGLWINRILGLGVSDALKDRVTEAALQLVSGPEDPADDDDDV